ncbi:MAG: serine/threonine protein kinase [Myxococcales bacterium]|nr:serine/threonine protein kinase [Myxococcales bacterium]
MTLELDRGVRIAGKYEIIGPLGQGAYGNVYRALQHPVERPVALKVISPHAATDEALRERFFREARAVARLNHPGAVILHDYGESNGLLYMVMELVEGTELKQIIKEEAPLSLERALDYARQILNVLVEAHGLDLIHRDLKPANIMIVRDTAGEERIKILDFGIAKLLDDQGARFQTQMGTVVGSPSYFSPEQAMGRTAGRPADQYSVGVILYEMLTGRKPFTGNSLVALINAHRFESVPPLPMELRCPAAVEGLIRRAMEKQPEDRFPDAKAMLDALDALQSGRFQASDRPPESRPTMRMDGAAAMAHFARHNIAPPPEEDEPRPKQTQPLPGLDVDERKQSGSQPEITIEDDPAARPKQTLALTSLGTEPPARPAPARAVPAGKPGISALETMPEVPRLPGVQEFGSETVIQPPTPISPVKIALIVGGAITAVGFGLIWLFGSN